MTSTPQHLIHFEGGNALSGFRAQALLARGDTVLGIDNLNDYYDPALKRARLAQLEGKPGFAGLFGKKA